jgi:uncharacterized protein (TIGR02265 family)
MQTEKLVFESALEGLFARSLADRISPALVRELKALGLDLSRKLPPAVPRDIWFASLEATARHVYRDLPRAEGLRELGREMMRGMEHTAFGRAMAPVVRMLGPRRILKRVPANLKSANNFASGVLTELSPTAMQLDVDDNGTAPEVFQGSLERILLWAGAKSVEVTIDRWSPPAARFTIRWVE